MKAYSRYRYCGATDDKGKVCGAPAELQDLEWRKGDKQARFLCDACHLLQAEKDKLAEESDQRFKIVSMMATDLHDVDVTSKHSDGGKVGKWPFYDCTPCWLARGRPL